MTHTGCCSVSHSRLTLCDPMDCSTPGFPVPHHLSEFAQTHVPWVSDAIQYLILFCPLLLLPSIFPSIRVFCKESTLRMRWPSIGTSASTSVLPMNTQDWSPLGWTGWISLKSKGLSRVFSNTTVKKHRHYITDKGPYCQRYGFASSHVLMWRLDPKVGWVPKY